MIREHDADANPHISIKDLSSMSFTHLQCPPTILSSTRYLAPCMTSLSLSNWSHVLLALGSVARFRCPLQLSAITRPIVPWFHHVWTQRVSNAVQRPYLLRNLVDNFSHADVTSLQDPFTSRPYKTPFYFYCCVPRKIQRGIFLKTMNALRFPDLRYRLSLVWVHGCPPFNGAHASVKTSSSGWNSFLPCFGAGRLFHAWAITLFTQLLQMILSGRVMYFQFAQYLDLARCNRSA